MPATGKLTKWGNSLGMRIPKQIVDAHNFKDGEFLSLVETPAGFAAEKMLRGRRYNPEKLHDGWNTLEGGEEIYFISNPALGLWAYKERFKE